MFCTSCGAKLKEEACFCDKCGAPVEGAVVAEEAHPAQAQAQPAPQPQPAVAAQPGAAKGKGKTVAIVVLVVAIVVLAVAVAFVLLSPKSSGTPSGSGASSTQVTVERSSASAEASSEASAEASSSASAQASNPAQSAASSSIDLSNPEDYAQINLFLSNFSELYFTQNESFTTDGATAYELSTFALWHTYRNSPDLVEKSFESSSFPTIERSKGEYFNLRITKDRCDEIVSRYFGRGVDYSKMTAADGMKMTCYRDGYVYSITTNGGGLPEGVTLARSATDQGDGTIRIDFEIYFTTGYDASDASLYSCTPEEIKSRFNTDKPIKTGTAVVRYGDYDDYTHGLKLVSWSTKRYQ